MRSLQSWLTEFSDNHQNPLNQEIHWLCVPLIAASMIGTIWCLNPLIALVALLLILGFYARLSIRLFLIMALFSAFIVITTWVLAVALPAPLWIFLAVFMLAWMGEFYGHKIEGVHPSFFKDLQFLLIGPVWFVNLLVKKFGISL